MELKGEEICVNVLHDLFKVTFVTDSGTLAVLLFFYPSTKAIYRITNVDIWLQEYIEKVTFNCPASNCKVQWYPPATKSRHSNNLPIDLPVILMPCSSEVSKIREWSLNFYLGVFPSVTTQIYFCALIKWVCFIMERACRHRKFTIKLQFCACLLFMLSFLSPSLLGRKTFDCCCI